MGLKIRLLSDVSQTYRFVNVLVQLHSPTVLWQRIKKLKLSMARKLTDHDFSGYKFSPSAIKEMITSLEEQYSLEKTYDIYENVSKEDLITAAQMYVALIICPRLVHRSWDSGSERYTSFTFLEYVMQKSPKNIFLILNKLLIMEWNPIFTKSLKRSLGVHYNDIQKLAGAQECGNNCRVPSNLYVDKSLMNHHRY